MISARLCVSLKNHRCQDFFPFPIRFFGFQEREADLPIDFAAIRGGPFARAALLSETVGAELKLRIISASLR